ncbi:protein Wnt-10b [Neodiprion pinetum]|uniref:Protein Wnt n=1 Tax=Neodiprion lecontei TaxID=441921 RepID=A0ABM3FDF4_NEOLC|nr:protein Wnt-10b-like [Neodiprion pinetum]XP_046586046.1 protein Wnt-10b [Neodiprion lecontei]
MPSFRRRVPKPPPSRIVSRFYKLVLATVIIFISNYRATCLMSNSVDDWAGGNAIVCSGIPGLTKEQRELCNRNSDVTVAALKGLQMAVSECQHQFAWHRWNCSSLTTNSRNQQSSILLQRGYRETAFAYAISAAGVAHSVARACSMGRLVSCGCDPSSYKGRPPAKARGAQWKWGGCSHNLDYGMQFSRHFLDSREKAGDIQSTVNLHNNQAGRLALSTNMQVRCKCHGMSGSCELKTCWKAVPEFRIIGKTLKDRFRSAILVAQSNLGNITPLTRVRGSRRRRPEHRQKQRKHRGGRKRKPKDLAKQLFYYQKSPNFCERDPAADIPGTNGRRCNRTSPSGDGCASLCCGRGYNVVRQRRTERCHCKFHWCCFVQCQNCTVEEWVTVCK